MVCPGLPTLQRWVDPPFFQSHNENAHIDILAMPAVQRFEFFRNWKTWSAIYNICIKKHLEIADIPNYPMPTRKSAMGDFLFRAGPIQKMANIPFLQRRNARWILPSSKAVNTNYVTAFNVFISVLNRRLLHVAGDRQKEPSCSSDSVATLTTEAASMNTWIY